MKKRFNIGLHLDACRPISSDLDLMVDMNKLYSLIPVLMTLTFTQGHKVMGRLELVQ